MDSDLQHRLVTLFRRTAASVPAYRAFLDAEGVDADAVTDAAGFARLPLITKENYHHRYPLPDRCRGGDLTECDVIAVSSGSTGTPTYWPRTSEDEAAATRRFTQVLVHGFDATHRRTLAVVCFPLGTWVGGLYTLSCLRGLAGELSMTVVAPGNNKAEILRVVPELGAHFDQVVLFGYPPFLKDVIDTGLREGVDWKSYAVKLVCAGEVFSEQWRDLMGVRAGLDPVHDVAALYGTADGGVLGNETPLSVRIRRFLAQHPRCARELFGGERLPTLMQYNPADRYFETVDGTLVFTADTGVPLIRYHIADDGGVIPNERMVEYCRAYGFDPDDDTGPDLPFVYVFGRSLHAVSIFGANVYPETVSIALEGPDISEWVTGKFVLEAWENADSDRMLRITVELAPGESATPDRTALVATRIRDELVTRSSEYANYLPAERRTPHVELRPAGDPDYFPIGVKHRYTR
ncbi:phenylacetate--CoA ligase family protein [Nocardia puris]|uniref:phenylacetate--CoA ligase family protein n=1 Tax=Nocardia puris TaxID=208602 RepID=UPI001894B457|nr:phenylacetate--CoA ligase family protein [Nocardia puris]MBF6457880.1 phenylacetate--CoA ligase family protein [Nocardia puris]